MELTSVHPKEIENTLYFFSCAMQTRITPSVSHSYSVVSQNRYYRLWSADSRIAFQLVSQTEFAHQTSISWAGIRILNLYKFEADSFQILYKCHGVHSGDWVSGWVGLINICSRRFSSPVEQWWVVGDFRDSSTIETDGQCKRIRLCNTNGNTHMDIVNHTELSSQRSLDITHVCWFGRDSQMRIP